MSDETDLFVPLKVNVIAATRFDPPMDLIDSTGWSPGPDGGADGEYLAEFAGRACYQSWSKPNKTTATNQGYLKNILSVGHMSVLEHGSISVYLEGVSRSLTHELVRHRHFSYSQLSQRYVDSREARFIIPPEAEAEGNEAMMQILQEAAAKQLSSYEDLVETVYEKLGIDVASIPTTDDRKRARQLARSVLGNFTETKIVVTGNYRAWRHFFQMRATEAADREIRRCAVEILRQFKNQTFTVFNDFKIEVDAAGIEYATSVYRTEV